MLCFQGKNFQAASKKAEPPRLVMLKDGDNDRFSGGVILADGVVVECLDTDGVLGMVLHVTLCILCLGPYLPKAVSTARFHTAVCD